jgi:chromosome segregation ATPase
MIDVWQERRDARNASWYARTNLRRRLEQEPVQVEDKNERWRREAEEQAAREAEHHERQEADRAAELTEQRRHEVNVARSWGRAAAQANAVIDLDTLTAISDTLNSLVRRLEIVEQKAEALRGEVNGAARQLNALSAKTRTGSERSGRQVAVLERKLEDQKDLTTDLRSEVRVLRAKLSAMSKQPAEARELHVVHHGQ